jgi:hypothetical protein
MNVCSVPQGHMPRLSYSNQRVNQIQKKGGRKRTEWEPPQTGGVGTREAIGSGC